MITAEPAIPIRQPGRSLTELIERESKRRQRRRALWWMLPAAIALMVAIAWVALRPRPVPIAARFRMQAVSQGDLVREVRATGHVEAVTTVQVGAEISGRIATVEVDYNDRVKAGQVLARFDRAALGAQLAQTEATLAAARAAARAGEDRSRAHSRAISRGPSSSTRRRFSPMPITTPRVPPRGSRAARDRRRGAARRAAGRLHVARTNLDHTVIRAPIDGVVITRNVDPGQTVASDAPDARAVHGRRRSPQDARRRRGR